MLTARVHPMQRGTLASPLGADEPVLLLCDCNMTSDSNAYRTLSTHLKDGFWEQGYGLGYTVRPKKLPFRIARVDYIWYSDHFEPIKAAVLPETAGSDHHPLVITFNIKNPH